MHSLITLDDILAARDRIAGVAVRTPLLRLDSARLQTAGFALPENAPAIYLKNEAAQPIGSFKLRGAYNNIAALAQRDPEALRRGVITFSSGNHAQGVAYAARALGTRAVIVMPNNAPEVKRKATEALGAEIVTVGPASTERRLKAEELVAEHGYAMVPPYDDEFIIAGQATCGLEIFEQLAAIDTAMAPTTLVLSPVSGGGLLSGTATGVKLASEADGRTPPQVWGCEPELAADARESFYSKQLVEWPATSTSRTLADGLRTQSLGERNFAHILGFVDGIVTVTEDEIRYATRLILAATDIVAEPSGAVTLAAALFHADQLPRTERIVAVVSGGNLDPALRVVLERENATEPASAHV
ncbi:MAG: threonine ammonia-lyase [Janthinobacterium lividum]